MNWQYATENIATLAAICFLCWLFNNYWGLILVLNLSYPRKSKQSNDEVTK